MTGNKRALALVTGGAHRLGRAIAISLAHKGYAILLHYFHSEGEAQQTAAELNSLGADVFVKQADLTSESGLASLFSEVDAIPYPLQVLVNSAAVMSRGSVHTLDPAEWDNTLALNLRAPFRCSQEAVQRMETGLIINITDIGAQKVWSGFPAYTVSKAGLESLTRVLARSLAPRIRVNAIAPGFVLPSREIPEGEWQRLVERVPLGRPAHPDEVASALVFLLDNEYITGQTIVIDGGYSLQ
jgi:NAD(P)-dependent dehydrogenase (short-subunit alcohol dehydrogenase family)